MSNGPWLSVVGIGEDGYAGLPAAVRVLVDGAAHVFGGDRHLAMLPPDHSATRTSWRSPLTATVADIRAVEGERVCVLATGDPMSYGIGVTLAREFGSGTMTVVPAAGAFSLAAARLGWPLEQVARLTIHGRPIDLIALHLRPAARILILSEDGTSPAHVAALLTRHGYGASVITVFEHLNGADENLLQGTANTWSVDKCRDLNTIAVECVADADTNVLGTVPGLPDEVFLHDGQLTKREVRAATLAALAPAPGALLWDVGCGNGSVAIEWMRAGGEAIGIEPVAERRDRAARNAATLGVPGLKLIDARAPGGLDGLPPPDAIFVGGGLTEDGLLDLCWRALAPGGRLVSNAVTIEGEARLAAFRERSGGEMVRLAVSRLEAVGPFHGWRPLMPVTQLQVLKPRLESEPQR